MGHWTRRDGRGQSEILGTVLVFSLVILLGVTLVGVGVMLFEDAGQEVDDRVGQDAMQELDDRLAGAQGGAVLELPDGTADQVETQPDEGRVTVTVTTLNETVGEAEVSPENIRADSMTNETGLDMGTIVHETSDGTVETVYQGGMLFERTPGGVQIISEPNFDYRLGTGQAANLRLGFTNITSLEELQASRELFVERDELASAATSQQIEELVLRHREFEGVQAFQPTAGIRINITIETEYPEAWATYGAERMTDPPANIWVPDDLDRQLVPDDDRINGADIPENTVEFEFPRFESSELEVPSFGDRVIYSGVSGQAGLFFNDTLGTTEPIEGGFQVINISNPQLEGNSSSINFGAQGYGIALADPTVEEWLALEIPDTGNPEPDDLAWVDVGNSAVYESGTAPDPIEEIGFGHQGGEPDQWEIDPEATICIVWSDADSPGQFDTENVLETVADGDCNEVTWGATAPPGPSPDLQIDDVVVTDAPGEDDTVFSDESGAVDEATLLEDVSVNVRLNNTGTGLANNSFVGVEATVGGERRLVAFDRATLYPFENPGDGNQNNGNTGDALPEGFDRDEPHDLVMEFQIPETIQDADDLTVFTVEDSVDREIEVGDAPEFVVSDLEKKDPGAIPGETFQVEATVENVGGGEDITQVVSLVQGTEPEDDVVDTAAVELADSTDTREVTFTWTPPADVADDLSGEGVDLTAITRDGNTETTTVFRQPDALIESVEIPENAEEGEGTLPAVTVELFNPAPAGDGEGLENVTVEVLADNDLIDENQTSPSDGLELEVDLDAGETKEVAFQSLDLEDNPITDWVTATTNLDGDQRDSAEEVGIVERDGPACDALTWNGSGDQNDPYEITNIDELQCMNEEDEEGWSEPNYYEYDAHWKITEDIAAHGTENWNSGAGFEPIGEWFSVGNTGQGFEGELHGNNNVIEGLHIDRGDESGVGIFAVTERDDGGSSPAGDGSRVANLTISDADVTASEVVGVLAGNVGGTLENIAVLGSQVEAEDGQRAALIVGRGSEGDLTNRLAATGTVDAAAESSSNSLGVGGVVGRTSYETDFNTSYARVDVSADSNVGGLAGSSSWFDTTFENMYFADEVDSTNTDGGAVVGPIQSFDDEIKDSVFWAEDLQENPNDGFASDNTGSTPGPGTISDAEWQPRDSGQMTGPQVLPDPDDDHDFTQYGFTNDNDNDQAEDEFFAQFPGIDGDDADGTMTELDWDIFEPVYETKIDFDESAGEFTLEIVDEGYPIFEWQAAGVVTVDIKEDTVPDEMTPGDDDLEVEVVVENTGSEAVTDVIELISPRDGKTTVDTEEVTLDPGQELTLEMAWDTSPRADRVEPGDANGDDALDGAVTALSSDTLDREEIQLNVFVDAVVRVDDFQVDETVEALNERGTVNETEVSITQQADVDWDDVLDNEPQLVLTANDRIVGALDIDEDNLGPGTGPERVVEEPLTWVPVLEDVGTTQLELEFVGQGGSATGETTVILPAQAFVPGETLPVDVDLEILTGRN